MPRAGTPTSARVWRIFSGIPRTRCWGKPLSTSWHLKRPKGWAGCLPILWLKSAPSGHWKTPTSTSMETPWCWKPVACRLWVRVANCWVIAERIPISPSVNACPRCYWRMSVVIVPWSRPPRKSSGAATPRAMWLRIPHLGGNTRDKASSVSALWGMWIVFIRTMLSRLRKAGGTLYPLDSPSVRSIGCVINPGNGDGIAPGAFP